MSYKYAEGSAENYDYQTAYNMHGNGVYLARGEKFENIIARDKEILENAGLTHQEVGRSLRELISTFNKFRMYRVLEWQKPIPGVRVWPTIYELGQEYSPYLKGVNSNIDWKIYIEGLDNGNKAYHPKDGPTFVSNMLPEMIDKLGFFEGTVFYGIQPEWAISVHNLVKKSNPQPWVPKYTPRAWDGLKCYGYETGEGENQYCDPVVKALWVSEGKEYPPDIIRRAAIHQEVVADGLIAFVAPGTVDFKRETWSSRSVNTPNVWHDGTIDTRMCEYWGLLVAKKEMRLAEDATLMGIPFASHMSRLGTRDAGEILAIRVFPYFDKLVG